MHNKIGNIPKIPTRPCAASKNARVSTPASVTGTSANDFRLKSVYDLCRMYLGYSYFNSFKEGRHQL